MKELTFRLQSWVDAFQILRPRHGIGIREARIRGLQKELADMGRPTLTGFTDKEVRRFSRELERQDQLRAHIQRLRSEVTEIRNQFKPPKPKANPFGEAVEEFYDRTRQVGKDFGMTAARTFMDQLWALRTRAHGVQSNLATFFGRERGRAAFTDRPAMAAVERGTAGALDIMATMIREASNREAKVAQEQLEEQKEANENLQAIQRAIENNFGIAF